MFVDCETCHTHLHRICEAEPDDMSTYFHCCLWPDRVQEYYLVGKYLLEDEGKRTKRITLLGTESDRDRTEWVK